MINHVDLVAILFIFYFACLGWIQGVMRFALAFLALLISSQITLVNFRGNYDILENLKIFLLLSVGLLLLLWVGLSLWNSMIVKSKRCTLVSRVLGASIGLAWATSLALTVMFALALIRIDMPFFKKASRLTQESWMYSLAESRLLSRYPIYQALKKMHEEPARSQERDLNSQDASALIMQGSHDHIQALYQNDKLQDILQDAKIQKMIEEKNITQLLAHPKIQSLLKDKDFVNSLLDFYRQIGTQHP